MCKRVGRWGQEHFYFDTNGPMISDMQYRITAWHRILNEFGANISVKRMRKSVIEKPGVDRKNIAWSVYRRKKKVGYAGFFKACTKNFNRFVCINVSVKKTI